MEKQGVDATTSHEENAGGGLEPGATITTNDPPQPQQQQQEQQQQSPRPSIFQRPLTTLVGYFMGTPTTAEPPEEQSTDPPPVGLAATAPTATTARHLDAESSTQHQDSLAIDQGTEISATTTSSDAQEVQYPSEGIVAGDARPSSYPSTNDELTATDRSPAASEEPTDIPTSLSAEIVCTETEPSTAKAPSKRRTATTTKSAITKKATKTAGAPRCGKSRTTHSPVPTMTTTVLDISLAPHMPPPASMAATRRRPITTKTKRNNKTSVPWVVEDHAPHRLVNPLADLPSDQVILAGDLWKLLDIVFPIPDTYSIAYLARVLGYRGVPSVVEPHRAITPARFVRGSLEHLQDPVYTIPPAGPPLFRRPKKRTGDVEDQGYHDVPPQDPDACLSAQMRDPFYTILLENECDDTMAPVTTAQLAKLNTTLHHTTNPIAPASSSPTTARLSCTKTNDSEVPMWSPMLQPTLDLAAELNILTDHVVATWQDGKDKTHDKLKDSVVASVDAGSNTVCGIILHHNDQPVAWASYTFAWYPCGPQKFELVLVVYNLQTKSFNLLESTIMTQQDELYMVVLTACVLEHARLCHVHYAIAPHTVSLELYFRMAPSNDRLVCDLHNCSSKYAFLTFLEHVQLRSGTATESTSTATDRLEADSVTHRWLAQLPTLQDFMQTKTTKSDSEPPIADASGADPLPQSNTPSALVKRRKMSGSATPVASLRPRSRVGVASLQAVIQPEGDIRLVTKSSGHDEIDAPAFHTDQLQLDLLRHFEVPEVPVRSEGNDNSEIVRQLQLLQQGLRVAETKMHSKIHWLMGKVMEERIEFENQAAARRDELDVLERYQRSLERRREIDMAWQKQLEQDMDAVCDVCADGEVTPDNQILFCEACNVAIHQMCYGIDQIPEGDYFCIPCRFLGRNLSINTHFSPFGESVPITAPKLRASPLPICCELCPRKQGAFIRTDVKNLTSEERMFGKWVHSVCAKWLGLDYVTAPDLVEDVTDWKQSFRRMGIICDLCQGERGCMNKCSADGCNKWLHVTCARAVGICEVIHGEDVRGAVAANPWTLKCPEHSEDINGAAGRNITSVEVLIQTAKEFPPEPIPPPQAVEWKPFNNATGSERVHLLNDKKYEKSLLCELTTKKLFGVPCEVCDQDIDPKLRMRCQSCGVVFCKDCSLIDVDGVDNNGNFKCARCLYISSKEKAGEEYETPRCLVCVDKNGWLRKGCAKPLTQKSHWAAKRRGFDSTLFGKQLWVHSICTFWHSKLNLSVDTGVVDCSNVVMNTGLGLVQATTQCLLCGNNSGLKVKCSHEGCAYLVRGKKTDPAFHVTCARMAGLEVNTYEEGSRMIFYAKCYRHGGNEFNLRAKLEDLLEIEKRRSGKRLAKSDAPMTFAHASRLLHGAIAVLRVLGWAWQWAELWVDYNSSWEPLLEPGENEEDMTKEQLKIVDSTRESRCEDARACRLAVFGAALRNRDYDTEEDFDRESFDRAITSILRTPSLVGPLEDFELDFYRHWLALAYWSKSRYLGFCEDKIDVNERSEFCLHIKDQSPKYSLNSHPLPGSTGDSSNDDVDNFLLTEVMTNEMLEVLKRSYASPKRSIGASDDPSSRTRSSQRVLSSPKNLVYAETLQIPGSSMGDLYASVVPERKRRKRSQVEESPRTDSSKAPKRPRGRQMQLPNQESDVVIDSVPVVTASDVVSREAITDETATDCLLPHDENDHVEPSHSILEAPLLEEPSAGMPVPDGTAHEASILAGQPLVNDGTAYCVGEEVQQRRRRRRRSPNRPVAPEPLKQSQVASDRQPGTKCRSRSSRRLLVYDREAVRRARRPPYHLSGEDDKIPTVEPVGQESTLTSLRQVRPPEKKAKIAVTPGQSFLDDPTTASMDQLEGDALVAANDSVPVVTDLKMKGDNTSSTLSSTGRMAPLSEVADPEQTGSTLVEVLKRISQSGGGDTTVHPPKTGNVEEVTSLADADAAVKTRIAVNAPPPLSTKRRGTRTQASVTQANAATTASLDESSPTISSGRRRRSRKTNSANQDQVFLLTEDGTALEKIALGKAAEDSTAVATTTIESLQNVPVAAESSRSAGESEAKASPFLRRQSRGPKSSRRSQDQPVALTEDGIAFENLSQHSTAASTTMEPQDDLPAAALLSRSEGESESKASERRSSSRRRQSRKPSSIGGQEQTVALTEDGAALKKASQDPTAAAAAVTITTMLEPQQDAPVAAVLPRPVKRPVEESKASASERRSSSRRGRSRKTATSGIGTGQEDQVVVLALEDDNTALEKPLQDLAPAMMEPQNNITVGAEVSHRSAEECETQAPDNTNTMECCVPVASDTTGTATTADEKKDNDSGEVDGPDEKMVQ